MFYFLQRNDPNVSTGGFPDLNSDGSWHKYSHTFRYSQANVRTCVSCLLFYANDQYDSSKWVEIKAGTLKLEKGNKATDWSPAPEDLQADATTKANNTLSESKKYTDAQLKITSDAIALKATKTDLYSYSKGRNLLSNKWFDKDGPLIGNRGIASGVTPPNGGNAILLNERDMYSSMVFIPVQPGHTYRFIYDVKDATGKGWVINGEQYPKIGFWYTKLTSGNPFDGFYSYTSYKSLGGTWYEYTIDNAVPRSDNTVQTFSPYFQIQQGIAGQQPSGYYGYYVSNLRVYDVTDEIISRKYTDAQLKITSDSITSTVSKTYATKSELSTTNGNVTKAQNTANNDSSTASTAISTANNVKNDLANLSIGGKNLARGTNMIAGANSIGWTANGNNPPTLVKIDGSWAIEVTRTSNSGKMIPSTVVNNWVLLEWGSTYKYSAEIMITKDFNTYGNNTPLHYWLDSSSTPDIINPNRVGSTTGMSVSGFKQIYMLGGKWYRFEYTIVTADTKPEKAYEYPMIRCFLYGSNNGGIVDYTTAYIRNLKIEKGNKPTDWSPAPEDYSTTTEMNSSINQTAESIKSTVAATYVNNKTLSSYATKSQLEQTSTSLTSRIQTTEKSVSGMSTTVKNVNDYMTFARENNQPTLTIGSSSSSFRTKLTNTGEKFMQGDQTIMELDGITSTVKASRVQMGHYQWRDTGTSMQLVYIP